jgi:protein-L-isoaspartate(D-aspartate) O-methyltransferase
MVQTQIVARGIKSIAYIKALQKVERHRFVPRVLKIGLPRPSTPDRRRPTISQPTSVALMTELHKLDRTDKVQEIGTGSAIRPLFWPKSATAFHDRKSIPNLAKKAKTLLNDLGYQNIFCKVGYGFAAGRNMRLSTPLS